MSHICKAEVWVLAVKKACAMKINADREMRIKKLCNAQQVYIF